ncbi:restriction endonuclease subunit S [Bacillus sp. JJ927]|uniref:restriction endonuclease subunit S n=1 Tax=Bacillus sp. JJ927 TaxID=3122976 RepID=UPI0033986286
MASKKKVKTLDELLEEALVPKDKQPHEIPEHWIWTNIGNIVSSMENRKPKDIDGEMFHYIDVDAIDNKNQTLAKYKELEISNAPSRAQRKVSENDVLISLVRPYLKNIALIDFEDRKLVASSAFYVCSTKNKVEPKYLYYYLMSPIATKYLNEHTKGDNSPSVRSTDFEKLPIPLPNKVKQIEIAKLISKAFSKIEKSQQLIEEAKVTFELRRAAILDRAFNGELTSSWRKNNLYYAQKEFEQFHSERKLQVGSKQELKKYSFSNYSIENDLKSNGEFPDNWIELPVGFICECIVPGRDKPKSFSGDIPWVTIPDIISETVYTSKSGLGLTEAEIKQVKAKVIPYNSVIMTCVGRFGISAVVQNPVVINQQLHAFLPNKIIDPKFLMYQIRTLEKYMQGIATSTTIAYLNKKNANSLPIKLPPIEEQKEIVIHLEKLLEKEESIFKILPSKNDLEELKQSILSKAFKGELGTKDSKDKPAMELLKSILQEKLYF